MIDDIAQFRLCKRQNQNINILCNIYEKDLQHFEFMYLLKRKHQHLYFYSKLQKNPKFLVNVVPHHRTHQIFDEEESIHS